MALRRAVAKAAALTTTSKGGSMKKRALYAVSTVLLLGALSAALLTGCGGGDGGASKEQLTQTETTSTNDQGGSSATDNIQTPPADISTGNATEIQTTQTPTETIPTTGPAPTSTQPPPTVPTTGPTEPATTNGDDEQASLEEKTHIIFKDSSMEVNLPSSMKFLNEGRQVSVSGMKSIKIFYWNDACVGWHVSGGKANEASGYYPPDKIIVSSINSGGIGNWSMISRDDRELFVDLSNVSASGVDYFIQDNQFYYGTAVTKDRNGNAVPNPDFKCPNAGSIRTSLQPLGFK